MSEISINGRGVAIAAAGASLALLSGMFLSRLMSKRTSKNRKLRYSARRRSETVHDIVKRLREQVAKKKACKFVPDETTEIWSAYWREQQLYGIYDMLEENAQEFFEAAQADFGKPYSEFSLELHVILMDIRGIINNLRSWMQPELVATPLWLQPSHSFVQYEPFGIALILGTWNFPMVTVLMPLCAAIAAGNACLIKPSEFAPNQAEFFAKYFPKYLDPDAFAVVLGEADIAKQCVSSDIDFCFYTGSGRVGAQVAASCAARHIPYVLELGGKCPCIIDTSCDLTVMARRVIQGKTLNAGQICLSPDHAIVIGDEARAKHVVQEYLIPELKRQYGGNPAEHPQFLTQIINGTNFNRVKRLLHGAEKFIVQGGKTDESRRFIEPTIFLVDPVEAEELDIFKEEIFGPLLPVVYFASLEQAIEFISKRQNPLALYMFSRISKNVSFVLSKVSAGSMCINDCCFQASNPFLPFGGVRESGIGRYHGKHGFLNCSNAKAIMVRSDRMDLTMRYNPSLREPWVQRALAAFMGWV